MKTKSPERIQGVMLPPSTRKHTDPCERIFLGISDVAPARRATARSFSATRTCETVAVAAIRGSIPRSALRLAGGRAKRARSTGPAGDAAESKCRRPGESGSQPWVDRSPAARQKSSGFVDTSCRREAEFPEFERGCPRERFARKLSLPDRALRWR